jgi:amidase
MSDTTDLDAVGTAAAIRAGDLTAREVAEQAIARIDKHDGDLNAVIGRRFDEALAEVDAGLPEGPLTGVPVLVKDLGMQVAGLPHTRGSRLWIDDVAEVDSELVARYKRAGMVVLGTTNSPELGKNASTEPLLHGPTRNPWSPEHSPGGSSGGSAAAVAAGFVPVAHGNDGGGSIRIPASMCGLFGLKPTRGRVTTFPTPGALAVPLSINHALTRSVRDSAVLLDVSSDPLPGSVIGLRPPEGSFAAAVDRDPGRLRIGLVTRRPDGGDTDPEVLEATRAAAALCERLGHRVEEADWTHDPEVTMRSFATLMGVSLLHQVGERLAQLGRDLRDDDLEPFTRMMWDHYSASLGATDVYDALAGAETVGWQVGRLFASYDVLLMPTVAMPPPPLGLLDTSDPQVMYTEGSTFSAWTNVFNLTGQPAGGGAPRAGGGRAPAAGGAPAAPPPAPPGGGPAAPPPPAPRAVFAARRGPPPRRRSRRARRPSCGVPGRPWPHPGPGAPPRAWPRSRRARRHPRAGRRRGTRRRRTAVAATWSSPPRRR